MRAFSNNFRCNNICFDEGSATYRLDTVLLTVIIGGMPHTVQSIFLMKSFVSTVGVQPIRMRGISYYLLHIIGYLQKWKQLIRDLLLLLFNARIDVDTRHVYCPGYG